MVRMWQARVSLIRSMMEARVVDFPEPVGPVTRHEATGELGQPFGNRRQVELREARNPGGDHPERQGCLAPLSEGAATESGPVQPGEGEVDVLLDIERVPLRGGEEGPDERVNLLAREYRGTLDRTQLAVDSDPWCRTTGRASRSEPF